MPDDDLQDRHPAFSLDQSRHEHNIRVPIRLKKLFIQEVNNDKEGVVRSTRGKTRQGKSSRRISVQRSASRPGGARHDSVVRHSTWSDDVRDFRRIRRRWRSRCTPIRKSCGSVDGQSGRFFCRAAEDRESRCFGRQTLVAKAVVERRHRLAAANSFWVATYRIRDVFAIGTPYSKIRKRFCGGIAQLVE